MKTLRTHAPATLLRSVVLHRGLHWPDDGVGDRPLENTRAAYERAWAVQGAHLAECDVTLTRDGEVVLAHDDDLRRVAREEGAAALTSVVGTPVSRLTKREVRSVALKDGSVVPTLEEVLTAASVIGGDARLVVEIKGKDEACAGAVAALMAKEPELARRVAVVMCFYPESVRAFRKAFPRPSSAASKDAPRSSDGADGPLVMLLTVAKARQKSDAWSGPFVDLKDTSAVEAELKASEPGAGDELDGLYVEYEPGLVESDAFAAMCARIPVGVWGRAGLDPDSMEEAQKLVARGVRFVNTDLPVDYFGSVEEGAEEAGPRRKSPRRA